MSKGIKSLHEIVQPKYEVVGDLERINEIDNVFFRSFMTPDSETWKKYYEKNPHLEKEGRMLAEFPDPMASPTNPYVDMIMGKAIAFGLAPLQTNECAEGEPAPKKIPIERERASIKIKGFAKLMGAEMVGIGPLNPAWVYNRGIDIFRLRRGLEAEEFPIENSHSHAIVVMVSYRKEHIQCAPHYVMKLATYAIYQRLAPIVVSLADYIRSLGYSARAHTHNGQLLDTPVAIDAGLGELGRNGIMVTEKYGCSMKPFVVTTDMPLAHDKPANFGLDEFCNECSVCADICPSGAIKKGEKKIVRGVKKWPLNGFACLKHFSRTGSGCSMCIAYCPYTLRHFDGGSLEDYKVKPSELKKMMKKAPEWIERE